MRLPIVGVSRQHHIHAQVPRQILDEIGVVRQQDTRDVEWHPGKRIVRPYRPVSEVVDSPDR